MKTLTTFSIGALQIGQTGVVLWFLISKAQGMQVCKCPQGTKSAFLGLLGSKQIEQNRSSGRCCFGIPEIFDESSLTAESCFCCCCSNCFCCSCFCCSNCCSCSNCCCCCCCFATTSCCCLIKFWAWRITSRSEKNYSDVLDIHISRHLAHDLFCSTKRRLTYFIPLWLI